MGHQTYTLTQDRMSLQLGYNPCSEKIHFNSASKLKEREKEGETPCGFEICECFGCWCCCLVSLHVPLISHDDVEMNTKWQIYKMLAENTKCKWQQQTEK